MKPTPEQNQAIEAFLSLQSLKVNAFAGTGKTSTLQLMSKSDTRRGIYLAFNKSIASDAARKFPSNVQALTSHSAAYRSVMNRGYSSEEMTGSLNVNALIERLQLPPLDIPGWRSLSPRQHAYLVLQTLKRFTQSADIEITSRLVPKPGVLAHENDASSLEEVRRSVSAITRQLWQRMITPGNAAFPLGHDGYFKLWSLSKPRLTADYIFLDEAQDSNPALLSVLADQSAQIVYVGDRFQQIYEWRGAVNAMERIETPLQLQLTQSFRFGPAIADVANSVLHLIDRSATVRGWPSIKSQIGCANPDTILTRTNASLIGYVLAAQSAGRSACVVGGTQELKWMLDDVTRLKQGRTGEHHEFFGYKNWAEVQEAVLRPEGEHLKTFVKIVDSYGEKTIINALSHTKADESEADLVLSTAHKSKGREWSGVMLDDDFFEPYLVPADEQSRNPKRLSGNSVSGPVDNKIYDYSQEEARLLYVAFTRAINALQIPRWCEAFFGIQQTVSKLDLEPKLGQPVAAPKHESAFPPDTEQAYSQQPIQAPQKSIPWLWIIIVAILVIMLLRR